MPWRKCASTWRSSRHHASTRRPATHTHERITQWDNMTSQQNMRDPTRPLISGCHALSPSPARAPPLPCPSPQRQPPISPLRSSLCGTVSRYACVTYEVLELDGLCRQLPGVLHVRARAQVPPLLANVIDRDGLRLPDQGKGTDTLRCEQGRGEYVILGMACECFCDWTPEYSGRCG